MTVVIDDAGQLTDLGRAVLEFEHSWWRYPGARASAIRDTFDWSETRHAQILNHLIDQPAAEAHDGPLVHRLRRLRDERRVGRHGAG
jgi:hypothetical protein